MKRCMKFGLGVFVFAIWFLTLVNIALADTEELRAIQAAIKVKGALWRAGESWVTRLGPDERRRLLGGSNLELETLDSVDSSTVPMNGLSSSPDAIDWRNKDGFNWVTPVKNQAMCGSCIAFSAVATLESLVRIESNQPDLDIDLSEQHLFNCGGGSCDYGWFYSSACSYLKNNGTPDEECWPYYPFNEPCSDTCSDWQSRAVKIADYGSISGIETFKTYIAIAPIMAGFRVYTDFYHYEDGTYEYTWGDYQGWHGVSIVGYDTTGEVPYWIAKNSWGSSWGENGFFRIKMGECNIETLSSYWISSPPSYGQEWAKTYGGNYSDGLLMSMQQTSDGGRILGVHSNSFTGDPGDGYNTWTFKVNSDGNITWEKKYVGYRSYPHHTIQTADGGYIAVGTYIDDDSGYPPPSALWVLKLNSDGTIDWQKRYGGSCIEGEDGLSIQQTFDQGGNPDGYIVLAQTYCYGPGLRAMWVLRLNLDGTIAWQRSYGGNDEDFGSSIRQTANGGYIVAGGTLSLGPNIGDMWVLKLNSDGTVDWQKTYGGNYATNIRETHDQQGDPDGYILVGPTTSFGAGDSDTMVLKLNLDGTVFWQKTYGGTNGDGVHDIEQTSDGGYVMVGATASFGTGGSAWILKINSDGTVDWQRTYGGSDSDWFSSIQQSGDDGYIVAGWTESFGTGYKDIWILKLNANGEIPGCSIMGTSQAVVTDTSVSDIDSNASIQNTSAVPIDTYLTDQDTEAETSDLCAAPVPEANFTANVTSGTASLTVQFTDQSTGSIDTWEWDFDDDGTVDSTAQSPAPWTYTEAGDYTVSLTVTGPGGPDTETKTDYITVKPLVNITELVPTHGGYGTTIKVKGSNFSDQRAAMIDAQDGYYSFVTFSGQSETMMATKYLLWSDTLVKVICKKLFIDQDGDYLQDGNEPLLAIGNIALEDYALRVNTIWFHDSNSNGVYDEEDEIYSSASSNWQAFTLTDEPVISKRLPAEIPRLDVLKIWGYNFGAEQGDGVVRIGLGSQAASDTLGLGDPLDGYLKWTGTVIKVKMRVPWTYNNKTRWIWVETGGKKSNAKPVKILPYAQ